jgi:hypothetical protein
VFAGGRKMPIRSEKKGVKQYIHDEQKRLNNPPVGLVTAETDKFNGKKNTSLIHILIRNSNGQEKKRTQVSMLTRSLCMFMSE